MTCSVILNLCCIDIGETSVTFAEGVQLGDQNTC